MNRILLLTLLVILISCKGGNSQNMESEHKYTNELINETSPYLLQHAHNPVNWYPWNEKTLALAKQENKLILISIGYAACHWCHVMEEESFEDPEVAAIMNEHFINIKVDREERPDVDQVYMNAVQLLTGNGGWPLNAVALPDGRPIWGGTYFPKDRWMNALTQLAKLSESDPEKLEEYASKLTSGIKQTGLVTLNEGVPDFKKEELELAIKKWRPNMDFTNGGRVGAPKFPMSGSLQFLLRYAVQNDDQEIMNYVTTSLTQMAYGGIYDQIGGGFSRYSVDDHWHIPHFEKMLYDNAQLVSLYSKAYLVDPKPLYKQVVYESLAFVQKELYDELGAFYTSLDADSMNSHGELEEGDYYVWTIEELKKLLGSDFKLFSNYFNVNDYGKWEADKYHLIRSKSDEQICKEEEIVLKELQNKLNTWKQLLSVERDKRNKPRLDDKVLTSLNALMLKGYVDAYTVFAEEEFLKLALKNAHFIVNNMMKEDGGLYRNYKNGKSNIEAYLEDYAAVSDAFISLYEVTLDENWLRSSKQLTDYAYDHFYDEKSSMFFFTSDKGDQLIARMIKTDDMEMPSSNSVMANNLFKLGHYFSNKHYSKNAETMLNNMKAQLVNYPSGASNWLNLYSNYLGDFYEVAIVGENALAQINEFNKQYIPNKLIVGSTQESQLPLLAYKYSEGETTIFVCIDGACKLPVEKTKEALKQIEVRF